MQPNFSGLPKRRCGAPCSHTDYGCSKLALTLQSGALEFPEVAQIRSWGCQCVGKILRKIFGLVQDENGIWRIRKNHELNELTGNADIVKIYKK